MCPITPTMSGCNEPSPILCVAHMRAPTSLRIGCSRRSDRGRHCNLTCRWSVAAAMTSTSPSMSMLLLVSSDACLCARSIPLHLPSRVSAHCAGTQAQPAPMRGSRGAGHHWTARDIANKFNDSNTLLATARQQSRFALYIYRVSRLLDPYGSGWLQLASLAAVYSALCACSVAGCFKRAFCHS